jgi:hypothetical protein
MPMKIEPARPEDIYEVAVSMRDRDYEEISCLYPTDKRADLADALVRRYGNRPDILCAFWHNQPVRIGGFIEIRPRVISMMLFATADFPKIGLGITRFTTRQMMPRLEAAGVHRFEAASLAGYSEVHTWLGVLGLKPETAPLRNFGKNGESFIMFSKVIDATNRPSGD